MMTGDVCFGGDTDIRFQSAKQYGRPINLRRLPNTLLESLKIK
jgi:hypothetical protein